MEKSKKLKVLGLSREIGTQILLNHAKYRRLKNRITQIKAEDGSWLNNMDEIQNGFTTFYQKLYQSQHHMHASEIQDQLKEIPLPSLSES